MLPLLTHKNYIDCGSRWQLEGFWTTFFHRHSKPTAIYGTIPSERNPGSSQVTPTHQVNEKSPHWNGQERLRQNLALNPTPGKESHNSQLCLEEWRVWTPQLKPWVLRLPPKREDDIHETYNEEIVLNGTAWTHCGYNPRATTEAADWNAAYLLILKVQPKKQACNLTYI